MKRIFDFTFSFIALIILSPLIILISIVIKFTSKGPVFFSQVRLTKNMKQFRIFKFRTMYCNSFREKNSLQIKGDSSEITTFGKIMRKTKIDEIPQLWNILKGDMSFIGPRPELPRRLQYYNDYQKQIFSVKSGISSPASIVFSNEEFLMNQVDNPEKFYIEQIMPYKIDLNIYYINHKSFLFDCWMIIATILKLFNKVDNSSVVYDVSLLNRQKSLISLIGVDY